MTMFWVVVGLMIAGALAFLVLPLLKGSKSQEAAGRSEANLSIYRDQLRELDADLAAGRLSEAQYKSARAELEKRALEDSSGDEQVAKSAPGGRGLLIGLVVAVPLLTVSLYFLLGKPDVVDPKQQATAGQQVTQEQIEEMVVNLAKKLESNPDDAQGWAMLGRSYATLRRFGDSSAAYARAAALMPDNSELLTDYADVLAMVNGRMVAGEPEKLIMRALQADPNNVKALALAGTAAFQRKDYTHAVEWWKKMIPLLPPDSPMLRTVNANISQVEGMIEQSKAGGKQARK